ncbi:hypothetical protein PR001_g19042 [Phytophthora rubi]|uniref:Uncharacterized protein n=1 Tax=Phytophthora rubi TaxID=129364 RepID=A0A6A3K034_9STRA|nr:hypothetical protein PR001_g19042 [Phytophthora rubi]
MVAGSTTSRSPSRSPPPVATAEELRQLNSTLRSRLARSVTDLEVALVSRDAALYDARQAEVVRLRGEIAAYQDTENPNLPLSPTVVNSPESSPAPPAKRRVAPLSPDAGGSSGSAEGDSSNPVDLTHDGEPHADNGAVSDDGGHADDSGSEASHQSSTKKGSAADSDNDDDACDENDEDDEGDEDTAEVSDELFKAQTLKALAQSRSAERRRRQASPRHGPKICFACWLVSQAARFLSSPAFRAVWSDVSGANDVSEANVRALLDAEPWKVFEGTGTAISFEIDVGG